jgi:uncharacterized protein
MRPEGSSWSWHRQRGARAVLLAFGEAVAAACVILALLLPADAQFWSPFGPPRPSRPIPQAPQQAPSFNPFGTFFGPQSQAPAQPAVDYSRAPSPARKLDTPPTTPVVVVGDAMADWLAYGLEEAFAENPEIGILRKHRTNSGLIRYDTRRDVEWAQVVREIIAADKPKYIVMMIGTNDHQQIRERAPAARPATPKGAPQPGQQGAPQPGQQAAPTESPESQAQASADQQNAELQENAEQPPIAAPEQPRGAKDSATGPFEFHSEKWEAAYVKRIDATVVALKSAGVPVFWVGLPAQRSSRATTDASYLNELYRARAERAGVVFVDIWDGFVDESGRYAAQGPDFEGQIRRLRSGDGVYFTKAGARKLAHYVEREMQRSITNRALPVALPAEPALLTPGARPGGSARPLAGPVVPLTVSSGGSEELLGGRAAPRSVQVDPVTTRVLVKGEPIAAPSGRADDFNWPRGSTPTAAPPEPSPPVATTPPPATATAAPTSPPAPTKPASTAKPAPGGSAPAAAKPAPAQRNNADTQNGEPKPPVQKRARPPGTDGAPRPPMPIGPAASAPQGTLR